MTIQEIENMVLDESNYSIILVRLLDMEMLPEGEFFYHLDEDDTIALYDRITVNQVYQKPTEDQMSIEFELYREESKVLEQERLDEIVRRQDLIERYANLKDYRSAGAALGKSNIDLYFKVSILDNTNHDQAEINMTEFESVDQTKYDESQLDIYIKHRESEYTKIDGLLKEALVEDKLGDSTKWDEYVLLRQVIKIQYPKPQ